MLNHYVQYLYLTAFGGPRAMRHIRAKCNALLPATSRSQYTISIETSVLTMKASISRANVFNSTILLMREVCHKLPVLEVSVNLLTVAEKYFSFVTFIYVFLSDRIFE